MAKPKIIVSGILFWYPLAGVTYQFLHYLIGLRSLGYDPYYIEDSGRWIYDPALGELSPDAGPNIRTVVPALEAHGFGHRWGFRGSYPGGACYGLTETELVRLFAEADALLNVTGAQEIREEHLVCRRRIYVESDPFQFQVRAEGGDASVRALLDAHDTHFSFGENIGAPDCLVPAAGYTWLPTRQPVALDLWAGAGAPPGAAYTTITTWHNVGKDVEYRGDRYFWTKDREFEKVLDLPRRRPHPFELAVDGGPEVKRLLETHGWRHVEAVPLSRSTSAYRDYILRSHAEFTVARDQYVRPRTGWFSDRSACYLAAGRPVITQETGFSRMLPTGRGLFAFTTIDDVLAAVDAIAADYAAHARAAREIAAEYFDAAKVVGGLLARAGLSLA
jgi:hypothetical protein